MSVRIIPRLDIKGPNLVKGVHLEGLRVLGKPEKFARHYYQRGADELLYMDTVASLYGRNSLLDLISRTAQEIFVPLTVGGGIRTIEDIRAALNAGADKVSINTAAIRRPTFITEAAQQFGSSTIVISIEAIRKPDGTYEAYTDNGRGPTGVNAIEWASQAESLGAGEILLTAIDQEGTGKGFDLELTRAIATAVQIPVIASGGAGRVEHVGDVVQSGRADAVCLASMLHYHCLTELNSSTDDYSAEGNTDFLALRRPSSRIQGTTIAEVKAEVVGRGFSCRMADQQLRTLEVELTS